MACRNLLKMASIDAQLRLLAPGKDALLLNRFLDILQDLHGQHIKETVHDCYELSAEYEGKHDPQKLEELGKVMTSLDPGDSIVGTKSFSRLLNLANLAEEVQIAYRRRIKLKKGDFEEVVDALKNQNVDRVLNAHPTQSVRRSLLQKHTWIRNCFTQSYAKDITPDDKLEALQRERYLRCQLAMHSFILNTNLAYISGTIELIQAAFRTDEIRRTPPSPQDEMRAGMSYFHETIWKGAPKFLRWVDTALKNIGINERVPYNAPFLFVQSDKNCMKYYSTEFWKQVPPNEPYRVILGDVRDKLNNTRERSRQLLANGKSDIPENSIFTNAEQILDPLELYYRSLCACGDRPLQTEADLNSYGKFLPLDSRLSDLISGRNLTGTLIFWILSRMV
ncbi:phosphoenolpyruvate carboxylase [Salix suchowensis]|nr:phosphoenolpyruvate carboxylase [Salix suchowensis]